MRSVVDRIVVMRHNICTIRTERDVDRRWNDTESFKLEYSEKNLSQCQFVNNKSNME
jgi:hypothetical protein